MSYDRDSFLAGLAVGRQLLGGPGRGGGEPPASATGSLRLVYRIDNGGYHNMAVFNAKGFGLAVDWGDGTRETFESVDYGDGTMSSLNKQHTYAESGDYTVTVTGDLRAIWFAYCRGLYRVLDPFPETMSGMVNAGHLLFIGTPLVEVPGDLFRNCPNFVGYPNAFAYTELTTIPAGLFDYCPDGVSFAETFCLCRELTTIPAGLFDRCTNVRSFAGCFDTCKKLTGAAPPLWEMFPGAVGTGCFESCTGLSNYAAIPSGWK